MTILRLSRGRQILAGAGVILCAIVATDLSFGLEALSTSRAANLPGVRHQIIAWVQAARDSPYANATAPTASLRLRVQVSDHAPDFSFYGVIAAELTEFAPSAGSAEKIIWENARCHRERGYPKLSLIGVEGEIATAGGATLIAAYPRQRGLRMPKDEITVQKDIAAERPPVILAIRAETKTSKLRVNLRLLRFWCML